MVYSVLVYFAVIHRYDFVSVKRGIFLRSHVFVISAKRGGDQKMIPENEDDCSSKMWGWKGLSRMELDS